MEIFDKVPPEASVPAIATGGSEVAKGFGIVALWNLGHLAIGGITLTLGIGVVLLLGIALIQLAYVVPLVSKARAKGLHDRAKGMIIAASVTALLSAACYGVVFYSLSHANFH